MIPSVWATSEKFTANSIYLRGHWITLITWVADEFPPDEILAGLGFRQTEKRNQFGTRQILRSTDWEAIDHESEIRVFDLNRAFVAAGEIPTIRPDHSSLLRYAVQLAYGDHSRFAEICGAVAPDTFFDLLRLGEIAADNVDAWHKLLVAYCARVGGNPTEVDLMRDVAQEVAKCKGLPVEAVQTQRIEGDQGHLPDWEPVAVLGSGADVIVVDSKGWERRAKLARTVYSDDPTAAVYQNDPLWITGIPLHDYEEVPRERVRADDGAPLKQRLSSFCHPVTLGEDDLEYLLGQSGGGPIYISGQPPNDAPEQLHAVWSFVLERMTSAGIETHVALGLAYGPDGSYWRLQLRVPDEIRTGGISSLPMEAAHATYVAALECATDLIVLHSLAVENDLSKACEWGLNISGRLDGFIPEGLEDAQTRTRIGRAVAAVGYTAQDIRAEIFGSRFELEAALPLDAEVPASAGSDDILQLRRASDGTFCAWLRQQGTVRDVILGEVVFGRGNTRHKATRAWVLQQTTFANPESHFQHLLASVQALDLLHGSTSSAESTDDNVLAVAAGISARFDVSQALSTCTEQWKEKYATELAMMMVSRGEGAELAVIGANKRKVTRQLMTRAELWRQFGGDRRRALDHMTALVRQQPGFKAAEILQFDQLALLKPELLREVSAHFEAATVLAVSNAGDRAAGRSDTGIVRGYARKHLYAMRREELAEALSAMGASALLDFMRTSKIWPSPNWGNLREAGVSPELAYLTELVRTALPNKYRSLAGNTSHAAAWVESVRDLRRNLENATSLAVGIDAVSAFLRQTGAIVDSGDRIRFVWAPTMIESLRPSWNRGNRSAYIEICSLHTLASHVQGVVQRKGPYTMIAVGTGGRDDGAERKSLGKLSPLASIGRRGPEWRDGLNVTEEDLLRTFAFTGVEYGNWTSQDERSQYMNFAYDSFCDLADITGLPRTALSLGGSLGLTFGSRGKGGRGRVGAHYEPDNKAIALTRNHGAGNLAHEYFHAFANYFGVQHSGGVVADLAEVAARIIRDGIWSAGSMLDTRYAGGARPEVTRAFAQLYWTITKAPADGDWSGIRSEEDITAEKLSADAQWVSKSQAQDALEKRKKPYWGNSAELFARGMEAWTHHQLATMGRTNDYLIRDERIAAGLSWDNAVFPSGDHLRVIGIAADAFFGSLQCEQRNALNTIGDEVSIHLLYSREGVFRPLSPRIMADIAMADVNRMLGDRATFKLVDALRDEDGQAVSGVYDRQRRIIEVASTATSGTVRHECWHAAHDLLLTEHERAWMRDTFVAGTKESAELIKVLKQLGRHDIAEICLGSPLEAQAYAFELYTAGLLQLEESSARGIFRMVEELFEWIRDALRGFGFSKPSELFEALESGELLHRSNLRNADAVMAAA